MATTRPVALVTGASSGIGKVASRALVEAGFEVVGTSRNTGGINERDGMTFLDLDVTSDESVTGLVGRVLEQFGRIDVLVNNAGMGASGAAEENSIAQAQRLFDLNVFGVIRMTKAVLPHMRAQGSGRIINISSIFGFIPAPYMAAYGATKYAIEDTPSPWTTKSASTACEYFSSSPPGPKPASTTTPHHPTTPYRSTHNSGTPPAR